MKLTVATQIKAPVGSVWQAIANIEKSAEMISGIKAVEVVDKPQDTLVGFKWKETREMFGKEAVETIWITEAKPNEYYVTRAENCGTVYTGELRVSKNGDGTELSMSFSGEAQTLGSKIMAFLMGWMMKGSMTKMLQQDIEDIRDYVEKQN